jgi:hypothetical protein
MNRTSSSPICPFLRALYNLVDEVVAAVVPEGVSATHVGETEALRSFGWA